MDHSCTFKFIREHSLDFDCVANEKARNFSRINYRYTVAATRGQGIQNH